MANVKIKTHRCKGCGLCVYYCPTKHLALSQALNLQGVRYAIVNVGGSCIGCGFCFHMCPDSCIDVSADTIEKKPEERIK